MPPRDWWRACSCSSTSRWRWSAPRWDWSLGWLVAPLIANPGAGLVGSVGAPPVTVADVGWIVALAVAVAGLAAWIPSVRAARTSTTAALADAARIPKRRPLLVGAASHLPVPLLLGLRLAARRPRRMILTLVSVTITMTTIVAVLAIHAHEGSGPADPTLGVRHSDEPEHPQHGRGVARPHRGPRLRSRS